MSASPSPRRHLCWAALALLIGGAGAAALLWRPMATDAASTAGDGTDGRVPLPPVAVVELRQQPASRPIVLSPALARAVAAVGQVDDGRRADLASLDENAAALVDQARALLGTVRRRQSAGLPMRFANGSVMRAAPDRIGDAAARPASDQGDLPPSGPAPEVVDGHLVPRSVDVRGRMPAPMRGDLDKTLVVADAWVAIPYDPTQVAGRPLTITNRSDGRYALSLETDDAGSVRLNGGLIVPGRYYLLDGTLRIESVVPVGVHVRPLHALPGYYEQPLLPPNANG